jgi:hypothetical protein
MSPIPQPTASDLRALLRRARRPITTTPRQIGNAAGWLFAAAVLSGFLTRWALTP